MFIKFCKTYGFVFVGFALCAVIFGVGFIIGAATAYNSAPAAPSASVAPAAPQMNYINATQATEPTKYRELTVTATAYCACVKCCGKDDGITATGTKAKAGRTIAVDPSVIPYGTEVIINGHTYIAEDCGGAIKGDKIDVFFDTHEEALKFGRKQLAVKIAGF